MARGAPLTQEEQGKILAWKGEKKAQRWMARMLGKSQSCISTLLKSPSTYGTTKRPGRKPSMSAMAMRQLVRAACKGDASAGQLKDKFKLPIGKRRVQQILRANVRLRWEKRQAGPWMTKEHQRHRVVWASLQLAQERQWRRVIFTDEKKFNLDGPDGLQYYWRDLAKEPQYYSKRQGGGGSVMIWAGFSSGGTTRLAFLQGKQDSAKYCSTLNDYLLPVAANIGGEAWILQQDNAPIHTSRHTKEWLEANNVRVLPWPARSPDLNPIENVWGWLVRRVYRNGRSYANARDLKASIQLAWNSMPQDYLNTLLMSMNKRCLEVATKKGRPIAY